MENSENSITDSVKKIENKAVNDVELKEKSEADETNAYKSEANEKLPKLDNIETNVKKSETIENSKVENSSSERVIPNLTEKGPVASSESSVYRRSGSGVGLNSVAEVQEKEETTGVVFTAPPVSNADYMASTRATVGRRMPHLHKLEKKHSSGDLHSRLKTRKLLGVGETDDGDVHRSKLSQILGHSDQLFIRLPGGLRIWQIVLAVVLSVLSLWALIFPSNYFHAMYDIDGTPHVFPIRLYACALICISVIYWYTVQASDRNVIRMVLLSSVVFFTLQSLVLMSSWLPRGPTSSSASFLCSVVMALIGRFVVVIVSSYYYWITFKDGKSKDVKYYR